MSSLPSFPVLVLLRREFFVCPRIVSTKTLTESVYPPCELYCGKPCLVLFFSRRLVVRRSPLLFSQIDSLALLTRGELGPCLVLFPTSAASPHSLPSLPLATKFWLYQQEHLIGFSSHGASLQCNFFVLLYIFFSMPFMAWARVLLKSLGALCRFCPFASQDHAFSNPCKTGLFNFQAKLSQGHFPPLSILTHFSLIFQ